MSKLTPRQEAFAREYIVDLNATQAAIRAGYSPKGAEVTASRMLRNTNVAALIETLMAERSQRVQVDADYLLKRLAEEAEADLGDLYYPSGGIKPIHEWPPIWRKGLVGGMDVEQKFIFEDGEKKPDGYIVKLKLSDRTRRLELIGKHVNVQAWLERSKVDVNDTTERGFASLTPEQQRIVHEITRNLEQPPAVH